MSNKIGEVTVYWGSMFSGKTTALINDLVSVGENAICFKPATDTRDGEVIRTHDGVEFPVTIVENPTDIIHLIDSEITTVGIEEASLFLYDDTLLPTIEFLRLKGYKVIITGLDLTAEGKPFGLMPYVASISDNCIKFRTDCANCGESASISHFKGEKKSLIQVGGADQYQPLCRNCWESNH